MPHGNSPMRPHGTMEICGKGKDRATTPSRNPSPPSGPAPQKMNRMRQPSAGSPGKMSGTDDRQLHFTPQPPAPSLKTNNPFHCQLTPPITTLLESTSPTYKGYPSRHPSPTSVTSPEPVYFDMYESYDVEERPLTRLMTSSPSPVILLPTEWTLSSRMMERSLPSPTARSVSQTPPTQASTSRSSSSKETMQSRMKGPSSSTMLRITNPDRYVEELEGVIALFTAGEEAEVPEILEEVEFIELLNYFLDLLPINVAWLYSGARRHFQAYSRYDDKRDLFLQSEVANYATHLWEQIHGESPRIRPMLDEPLVAPVWALVPHYPALSRPPPPPVPKWQNRPRGHTAPGIYTQGTRPFAGAAGTAGPSGSSRPTQPAATSHWTLPQFPDAHPPPQNPRPWVLQAQATDPYRLLKPQIL